MRKARKLWNWLVARVLIDGFAALSTALDWLSNMAYRASGFCYRLFWNPVE